MTSEPTRNDSAAQKPKTRMFTTSLTAAQAVTLFELVAHSEHTNGLGGLYGELGDLVRDENGKVPGSTVYDGPEWEMTEPRNDSAAMKPDEGEGWTPLEFYAYIVRTLGLPARFHFDGSEWVGEAPFTKPVPQSILDLLEAQGA